MGTAPVFNVTRIGGACVSVPFDLLEGKPSAFLLQCQEQVPKRALWGAAGGFVGSASTQKSRWAQRNITKHLGERGVVLV